MHAGRPAALAVAASLLLAACAPGLPQHPEIPAEAAARHPSAPGSLTAPPMPGEPGWDEESRAAAVATAEAVMDAFARPDLDEEEWWSALAPLLSPEARPAYAAVDPANVPARRVTGTGKLLAGTSAYIARVQVPTNVGTYTVLLSRDPATADGDSATAPWQGERITPPAGVD